MIFSEIFLVMVGEIEVLFLFQDKDKDSCCIWQYCIEEDEEEDEEEEEEFFMILREMILERKN